MAASDDAIYILIPLLSRLVGINTFALLHQEIVYSRRYKCVDLYGIHVSRKDDCKIARKYYEYNN